VPNPLLPSKPPAPGAGLAAAAGEDVDVDVEVASGPSAAVTDAGMVLSCWAPFTAELPSMAASLPLPSAAALLASRQIASTVASERSSCMLLCCAKRDLRYCCACCCFGKWLRMKHRSVVAEAHRMLCCRSRLGDASCHRRPKTFALLAKVAEAVSKSSKTRPLCLEVHCHLSDIHLSSGHWQCSWQEVRALTVCSSS
jgi:hypothetical protein